MRRNSAPHCVFQVRVVSVVGYAVFIALQSVFKNIFRYFTEVKIQVAAFEIVGLRVEERIEKPELHIFYIALLEVGIIHLAHNAAPALFGVEKSAVVVDVHIVNIIRAALVGIKTQIESLNILRLSICDIASGENLTNGNIAHIWVRQLRQVALYIAGTQRGITLREQSVDEIPV